MNTLESKVSPVPEAPSAPSPSPSHTQTHAPKLGGWVWLIIVLIVVGVVAGFVPRWLHKRTLAAVTLDLATPTVQVMSAAPGKASGALLLPAEVRPFAEAAIYARASGFVKKWYVDIGATVKAGQLLADVDSPELDQQLSGAQAELAQAEAASSLAQITAKRWAELLKTSSVSEQEDAEKQADFKLKIAAVDTARANMHRLEDLQSYTHVVAPFAGTLTARDIDTGDLVSSGKEMFRVSDTSKLRIFVRVPQTATPGIKEGVAAELIVPEMPGRKFMAKVVRTAGAIDAISRTLLTELEVENPKNEIFAGSYAQLSFVDFKQDPALVLPANTLLFRDGMQVGVVQPDGKVELRNVSIGRDFGKTVEVTSGITALDRIIINPADSLTTGMKVRVMEAPLAENTK